MFKFQTITVSKNKKKKVKKIQNNMGLFLTLSYEFVAWHGECTRGALWSSFWCWTSLASMVAGFKCLYSKPKISGAHNNLVSLVDVFCFGTLTWGLFEHVWRLDLNTVLCTQNQNEHVWWLDLNIVLHMREMGLNVLKPPVLPTSEWNYDALRLLLKQS